MQLTHIKKQSPRSAARLLLLIAGMATAPAPAIGHELRPAIATIDLRDNGQAEIAISLNLEAAIAEIGPEHQNTRQSRNASAYDGLRIAGPEKVTQAFDSFAPTFLEEIDLRFDGKPARFEVVEVRVPPVGNTNLARTSDILLTTKLPGAATALTWRYGFGDSVVRLRKESEDRPFHSAYVGAGQTSGSISLDAISQQSALAVFLDYIPVGFDHIIPLGVDHILFVVGLFLLATSLRALLVQVSTFTVAHSVTLALAMAGFVKVPAAIVEPLIAASIVFIALENVFPGLMPRWRLGVVFGFGLLHGLGFAGALAGFGLPQAHFIAGLIGFNIGVEIGQIAVIALCFLAVGLWFSGRPWYRAAVAVPASLVIAVTASYWTVERLVQ